MKKLLLVLLTAVLSLTLFVSVSATSDDPVASDDSSAVSEDVIDDSSVVPEEPSSAPEVSEVVSETVSETESDVASEAESTPVSSDAESIPVSSEASESSEESSKDDMGVDLDFQPNGFARNLKYMGLGMLGIFVVVGVVILITFVLNSVTGKKKD